MSVVVVGGNDRMATRYKEICKSYGCKAKVFTQMPANFDNKIGTPDLAILFTSTVSLKMALRVNQKAEKHRFPVARVHSSSVNALHAVLSEYCQ